MAKRPFKICLTGGPGAGKTAVTDLIKREFSSELAVLPESASILYGGGFPRAQKPVDQRAVQNAIYHVQLSAEMLMLSRSKSTRVQGIVCDRGTLDGVAYWPGTRASFLKAVGTTLDAEFARYDLVLHLETASASHGYDHSNPLRTESVQQALALDRKISSAWKGHPKVIFVEARESFIEKTEEVLGLIRAELR